MVVNAQTLKVATLAPVPSRSHERTKTERESMTRFSSSALSQDRSPVRGIRVRNRPRQETGRTDGRTEEQLRIREP